MASRGCILSKKKKKKILFTFINKRPLSLNVTATYLADENRAAKSGRKIKMIFSILLQQYSRAGRGIVFHAGISLFRSSREPRPPQMRNNTSYNDSTKRSSRHAVLFMQHLIFLPNRKCAIPHPAPLT